MSFRRLLSLALALGGPALLPAAGSAQIAPGAAGTGISYQLFHFDDPEAAGLRSLALLTVPFAARTPIVGTLRLDLSGAYARGMMERRDGTEATISGLTDTQLRIALPLAGELLTVSGLVLLPTGLETPTPSEAEVAGAIASDLLPFRISNWGSGGGGGLAASLAHSFGALGVGMSASYIASREFSPLAEADFAAYRPGDMLSMQMAVNRDFGQAGRASLQLLFQHFDDDQLQGINLFRSGDRYQAIGSYAFRVGRTSSGIVYLGGQHRESGAALLELSRDAPSQTLLLVGGGIRRSWLDAVVSPSADLRVLRSHDGVGQGYVAGLGTTAEWSVGRFRAGPQLRVQMGRVLVREGAQSGFLGGELGLTIHL